MEGLCASPVIEDNVLAKIRVEPRRTKCAIVGFASNTLHLVPWNDPEFEIWGMNQGYAHMPRRADRWFEMHSPEFVADMRDPNYIQFLMQCHIPVYMQKEFGQHQYPYPSAVKFPLERATEWLGRKYFQSSVAYMLTLAALEGFKEVHLYGINLAIGEEWFYEKANCEYVIGKLEAAGILVHVPYASSLLKQYGLYGYDIDRAKGGQLKILMQARINEYRGRAEKLLCDYHTVMGALKEDEQLIQIAEGVDHGAEVVLMPAAAPAPTTAATT